MLGPAAEAGPNGSVTHECSSSRLVGNRAVCLLLLSAGQSERINGAIEWWGNRLFIGGVIGGHVEHRGHDLAAVAWSGQRMSYVHRGGHDLSAARLFQGSERPVLWGAMCCRRVWFW